VATLSPVERTPGDHAANVVHRHLRELILDGVLAAGTSLNQVTLAAALGVSRTPIREAIRMLQEEGLVDAQPQKRAKVVGFDPLHLETVYAQRVLLEPLAAAITAAAADDERIGRLDRALERLDAQPEERLAPAWRRQHTKFHLDLVGGVQTAFQRAIRANMERGEHYRLNYRLMYEQTGTRLWDTSPAEHRAIVEAFRRRDGRAAATELARHLARTALVLVEQLTPEYEPVALRAARALYVDDRAAG
jgi:DNA-binding GntR family transcriptional regulator